MTDFQTMMQRDAVNVFLSDFAENVVYTPFNPTTANPVRTIKADVVRDPPMPLRANENFKPPKMTIKVANDQTYGISSATLDTGGDTITVAYRIGTPVKAYQVQLPQTGEDQDAAMLTFELR